MRSELSTTMARLAALPRDEAPAIAFANGRGLKLFTRAEAALILGIPADELETVVAALDQARSYVVVGGSDWHQKERIKNRIFRRTLQGCIAHILRHNPAWYSDATRSALLGHGTIRGFFEDYAKRPRRATARPPSVHLNPESTDVLHGLGISWDAGSVPPSSPGNPFLRHQPGRAATKSKTSADIDSFFALHPPSDCGLCASFMYQQIDWDSLTRQ